MTSRGPGPHIFDKLSQLFLAVVYANESGVQLRLPEYDGRLHKSDMNAMLQVQPASASAMFLLY